MHLYLLLFPNKSRKQIVHCVGKVGLGVYEGTSVSPEMNNPIKYTSFVQLF